MPARILAGAMCVQRFDDSLNSAIHITYRISLRSSSMPEPRDPLLKVLIHLFMIPLRHATAKITQEFRSPGGRLVPAAFSGPSGALTRRSNGVGISSQGFGSCKTR